MIPNLLRRGNTNYDLDIKRPVSQNIIQHENQKGKTEKIKPLRGVLSIQGISYLPNMHSSTITNNDNL